MSTQMQTIIDLDPRFHLASSATPRFGPGQQRPGRRRAVGDAAGSAERRIGAPFSVACARSVVFADARSGCWPSRSLILRRNLIANRRHGLDREGRPQLGIAHSRNGLEGVH